VFGVTLGQLSGTPVTVVYQTADGTAIAGKDYVAQSGTLTIAANTTTQFITVAVNADPFVEPSNSFYVNLSNPVGAFIGQAQAIGSLQNNNTPSWRNVAQPTDANGDGIVTPLDSLVVLNYLNANGPGTLGTIPGGVHDFYDVNGDGLITSLDALIILNQLNASVPAVVAAAVTQSPAATDVAFALSVKGVAAPLATGPSIAVPGAAATLSPAFAATSAGPPTLTALAAAAARPAASPPSVRRPTSFDAKTDVEDLLDLLV